MTIAHKDSVYEYGSLTVAATSAAYNAADTITWTCPYLNKRTITVIETGGVNSLTLRVRKKMFSGATNWIVENEGTLAASGETTIDLNNYYYQIEIAVKDGSGHAAVEIGYGGRV